MNRTSCHYKTFSGNQGPPGIVIRPPWFVLIPCRINKFVCRHRIARSLGHYLDRRDVLCASGTAPGQRGPATCGSSIIMGPGVQALFWLGMGCSYPVTVQRLLDDILRLEGTGRFANPFTSHARDRLDNDIYFFSPLVFTL